MSEMIERVARALCTAAGDNPDAKTYAHEMLCTGRDRAPTHRYQYWETFARAAIEAMREPTAPMIDSGVAFALNVSLEGAGSWSHYVTDKHRRMIDAALSPHERGG